MKTEAAVAEGTAVGEAEAASQLSVPVVEALVVGESASKSEDAADNEDEVPVTPKRAPTVGGSGLLPVVVKRASKSTTPSKRCLQKVVPQYEDKVVLDADCPVGENVPGVKGKKTVSLAAHQDFKQWKGSYPTGAQPCLRCDALKSACTFFSIKSCKHGKVDPHVQHNFEKAVLVWQARVFVLEQRKLSAAGETITISAASLALPTAQESGIMVENFALAPSMPKGKGKALAVPTPCKHQASTPTDKQPAKQSWSGMASQRGSKTPVEPVLCPGGIVLSDPELSSSSEAPHGYESDAKSASKSSESSPEVLAPLSCIVQPNWSPMPLSYVTGQEFLWLRKALDYPISTLHPTPYIETAREKAAEMAEVMHKDMWAAAVEMAELWLQKKIMEPSVDILERYQADRMEALEWQEANEVHIQQPFATLFRSHLKSLPTIEHYLEI
ncbi:hypothetical protein C0992_002677 [Termitomyces sp. T32_za158]|nr:hypothetical protein C0992_002677 [Termitomyces sp. T32_za158]